MGDEIILNMELRRSGGFLDGHRIFLRGLLKEDLQFEKPYYGWLEDMALDQFTQRNTFPNSESRMSDYLDKANRNQELILLGIFLKDSGIHIGNIAFSEIDWINRRAFIAYLLGDKDQSGKGLVTEAILMMMYYGFNRLNFNRIHGGVSNLHKASMRVCEKVGLEVEGTMRQHMLRNGEFSDTLIVGAVREEWMGKFGQEARKLFLVAPTY